MKRDYYDVLGISKNAGPDEIKHAYRKLAREVHPDVAEHKKEAEARFKEINEAFAILSNPEKRERYDHYGHAGVDSSGGGFGFDFGSGFDVFEDLIGSFFRGGSRREALRRGEDLRTDLTISLEEAYTGVKREITIHAATACSECGGTGAKGKQLETCVTCRGAGQVEEVAQSFFGRVIRARACPSCGGEGQILKDPCRTCSGRGVTVRERKIAVDIPPGVDSDNRIRMTGQGGAAYRGGTAGDLYVFIHVQEHPKFKREDRHLFYEAVVSFPEAVLGNEIEVPTLTGPERIHVPPGTQNGTTHRLKGKGMPSLNGHRPGDEIVIFRVDVPKKITEKSRQLLVDLAQNLGVKLEKDKGLLGRVKDALS